LPATLNTYLKQTMRFLHEAKQSQLGALDLIDYINRSRRETAMRGQCIRRLTPVSGQVLSASVVNPGSGYTLGVTIGISGPDFFPGTKPFPSGAQATAGAIVQNGTIAAVDVLFGGAGYMQPTGSVIASAGTGASVTFTTTPINTLNLAQEVYPFSDIDVTIFPGVQSVYMVKGLSVIFGSYRYSLACYAFSVYQALIRRYTQGFFYVPEICSQFGQGVDGSFYVYPPPSQQYPFELDCFCLPQDLLTDGSTEALPDPWTDAVPYFAASLCYANLQNFNAAKYYEDAFDKFILRHSNYARPGRMVNPYGRY
jgi:hypothetical protein